jgi:hypothetical protein
MPDKLATEPAVEELQEENLDRKVEDFASNESKKSRCNGGNDRVEESGFEEGSRGDCRENSHGQEKR